MKKKKKIVIHTASEAMNNAVCNLKDRASSYLVVAIIDDDIYYQFDSNISAKGFASYIDNVVKQNWNGPFDEPE